MKRIKISNGSNIISQEDAQHLILDDTVVRADGAIKDEEFLKSPKLKTVQILPSSNLTNIGKWAFYECKSLQSVHISANISNIRMKAFYGCSSLESICLPNSLQGIGDEAFFGCSSLRLDHIPNTARTIGNHAFGLCKSLVSIHIPNSIARLEGYAFYGCVSLRSIQIPRDYMEGINVDVFYLCRALDQRQPNAGLNYNSNTIRWLKHRFDDLPIHQACYDYGFNASASSNLQLDTLSGLVEKNEQTLAATDAMGMTSLHILCCNPNATFEAVQNLVKIGPSALSHEDVTGKTPVQLFLLCRGFLGTGDDKGTEEDSMPSLFYLLEKGIKSEDLKILFVLNKDLEAGLGIRDGCTELLPFMTAATISECGLDVLYNLAMKKPDLLH